MPVPGRRFRPPLHAHAHALSRRVDFVASINILAIFAIIIAQSRQRAYGALDRRTFLLLPHAMLPAFLQVSCQAFDAARLFAAAGGRRIARLIADTSDSHEVH